MQMADHVEISCILTSKRNFLNTAANVKCIKREWVELSTAIKKSYNKINGVITIGQKILDKNNLYMKRQNVNGTLD